MAFRERIRGRGARSRWGVGSARRWRSSEGWLRPGEAWSSSFKGLVARGGVSVRTRGLMRWWGGERGRAIGAAAGRGWCRAAGVGGGVVTNARAGVVVVSCRCRLPPWRRARGERVRRVG